MGGEPCGFFAGAFFVEFGVSMIEDLDFDPGVWQSVWYETFEGVFGGPEEESGVSAVGEVSPPADEFEVSVFFLGSQDADRIAGAVDQWAIPSPGIFVAVRALEIVFTEFDPAVCGCIDLNRRRCSADLCRCFLCDCRSEVSFCRQCDQRGDGCQNCFAKESHSVCATVGWEGSGGGYSVWKIS